MSAMCVTETNRFQYWNKPKVPTRRDSGEIDVFEASGYYSGGPEIPAYTHYRSSHRPMMEETKPAVLARRKSLDISDKNSSFTSLSSYLVNEKCMIQPEHKKEVKLPSSPGRKLAGFLASIFSQATSSKKKSKSTSESVKYETQEICPGMRRRSSIGHSYGNGSDRSKLGFRTPSPIPQPSNVELYSKVRTLSPPESAIAAASVRKQRGTRILQNKIIERESERTWVNEVLSAQKSLRRSSYDQKVQDGEDSDSSSDLFDLPNYVLGGVYSNGLPAYEHQFGEDRQRENLASYSLVIEYIVTYYSMYNI